MRVCPHCELPTIEAGSFCPSCGKPMPAQEARPQQALMGTFRFPPTPPAPATAATAAAPAAAPAPAMRPVVTNMGAAVAATPPRLMPPSGSPPQHGMGSSAAIAPLGPPGPHGGSSAAMAPPAAGSATSSPLGSGILPPRSAAPSPAPLQVIAPMPAQLVPAGSPTADSISIPDPRNALLGVVVDGFAIDSILGSGGCGTVYRGRQLGLDRPVAIKVPTFDVVDDPVLKKRFLREARAAARVRHPSVVTIYGVGEVPDGRPYLAMELLDGVSLMQVLDDGPLPIDRALALARQIALALAETHAAGVVHRDLKPSNIIWRQDRSGADRITIVDFGIAAGQQGSADATRLTAGGKVIGTPHYMAPEQAQGEHQDIDHRTDLYALGCLLFELLTNDVPFDGTGFDVVLAHMAKQPDAPSKRLAGIPRQVDELVLQLLRKRPEERPGSAEEVVRRIDEVRAAISGAPRRGGPPRVATAPPTAETATALTIATDDTAAAMMADEDAERSAPGTPRAAAGSVHAVNEGEARKVSGEAGSSGWPVGYAAPEPAEREERSGRVGGGGRGRGEASAAPDKALGTEGGSGGIGGGLRGSGARGETAAGVGAASTMLAVTKAAPPQLGQQGPGQPAPPHHPSHGQAPPHGQAPQVPPHPTSHGQAQPAPMDAVQLAPMPGAAGGTMGQSYSRSAPQSHQPPATPSRPRTAPLGMEGAPRRPTHTLSSAALVRRRQRRWRLAAVALGVCALAALTGVSLQRMLRGEERPVAVKPPEPPIPSKPPPEPGPQPDAGPQTIILTSDELSLRMTAPKVLPANRQVLVRLEIWDAEGEPLDTRVVVTIEPPKGKPIGLKANAVTSGVYEFVQDFATVGRNVVSVFPEATDATFEVPLDVVAGAARDGKASNDL